MTTTLSAKETKAFVSIVNNLIAAYCDMFPDDYEFDSASIGYLKDGRIVSANGDDLIDTLEWVNSEVVPGLVINECNRSMR